VRWQHPDRGLLFPAAFLPTPTQVNVIDFKWQKPLFDWVFARACKTAATLKGEKYISVNVSPLQFAEEGFIQQVKKSIDLLNLERKNLPGNYRRFDFNARTRRYSASTN
jgi:EAL domain-containing protein (putative c-di-GMP-specific phosphodiesterase class I)